MKALETILMIIAIVLIAIACLDMVIFNGWVLPITGLLIALVMLEFVRIIAVWEAKDKGVDKHE
jgi:hypothetical protein